MKRFLKFTLLALVILSPNCLQAKTFTGTVQMRITRASDETHNLSYSIKSPRVRIDIKLDEDNTASAIMDMSKDEMILLMPGQPMYMTMSIKTTVGKATGLNTDKTDLENTGITAKILGYTCTKYLSKTKDGVIEIWATDELGTFMGLGNMMGMKTDKAGWEKSMVGKNFFPLRVKTDAKSKNSFSLEATVIEPKSLPDSYFAPPEGYQKFDMGGANPFG